MSLSDLFGFTPKVVIFDFLAENGDRSYTAEELNEFIGRDVSQFWDDAGFMRFVLDKMVRDKLVEEEDGDKYRIADNPMVDGIGGAVMWNSTYVGARVMNTCCYATGGETGCGNEAEFQLWDGKEPVYDHMTYACGLHLALMIEDGGNHVYPLREATPINDIVLAIDRLLCYIATRTDRLSYVDGVARVGGQENFGIEEDVPVKMTVVLYCLNGDDDVGMEVRVRRAEHDNPVAVEAVVRDGRISVGRCDDELAGLVIAWARNRPVFEGRYLFE